MRLIFGDFETYYSEDYTLDMRKSIGQTAIEYILDPRYETIMCAIAVDNEPAFILERDEVREYLLDIDEPYAFVSHNAMFDAAILAYRYGVHPAILIDTLSMCRAALNYQLRSLRLADVLEHFQLEAKGTTIKDVKGMHINDIKTNGLWDKFVYYCKRDCEGMREIYVRLINNFTAREMRIMDRVIRMVTQPTLQLNIDKLRTYYTEVITHKENLLEPLGVTRSELMSNQKFATLLTQLGVEIPLKYSPRTNLLTYAFAKTDSGFMELQEHPDERVQQLVEARLGTKTTIEETRTKRFINIAETTINSWDVAFLPIPLKYSGAHTHRLSGDWKLNPQNLSMRKQRILREAIEAPPGYYIIAIDAKQIEARLTAWLADQVSLLDAFREERDIYTEFASAIYYTHVRDVSKVQRFTGKTCILGLGFGMSATKLLYTLRNAARDQGFNVDYDVGQTEAWVTYYRTLFPRIVDLWTLGRQVLLGMLNNRANGWRIGPCVVDGLSIVLPSKLRLQYYELHRNSDTGELWYTYAGKPKKIYGAKLIENVVQALDRQFVMDAAMNIETRCQQEGIEAKLVLQLHDENVYCVPREVAKRVTLIAYEEMSRPPWWGRDFPAAAEVKAGKNYADLLELKLPKIRN